MAFDPNISLGNLITIGTTAIGLVIYFVQSKAKIDRMEKTLEELVKTVSGFHKADTEVALLRQRLESIEGNMEKNFLAVHTQRLVALEAELNRARDNIHLLGNQMQVELFRKANEAPIGARR